MILITSHEQDDHAIAVRHELDHLGHPVTILDTSLFPIDALLNSRFSGSASDISFQNGSGPIDLSECGAIWWRRPRQYSLAPNLDPDVFEWTYQECHEALMGSLAAVQSTWVNDPQLCNKAAHKPYQLALARRLGIPFPETLMTNDPARARDFIAANGPGMTVFKTFVATPEHWRETRVVGETEMQQLDSLRHAPTIFQRRVHDAVSDLRITVIGDEIFATEIGKLPGLYAHDYRLHMDKLNFRAVELDEEWQANIRRLMSALGLVYGAIDLMRRADGTMEFLEINPAGEWMFVSEQTGQPITRAMANLLIALDLKE